MTNREKAIVMAHTQTVTLVGDDLGIYYKYVEEILGRPVMTHDLGLYADEIVEKSKPDFIKMCQHKDGTEGISITYPFDEVYYIVNQGTKDAWISSKSVRDLTIWEIEGIDKDGKYFSTKGKAEMSMK